MTTRAQAREALYQAFVDGWTPTGFSFTFDNEAFTPPENLPWARFSVRHAGSAQESLGGIGFRKFLRTGVAITQIFTLAQQGSFSPGLMQADELSTLVRNIFEGNRLRSDRSLRIFEASIREIGPEGKWYQTQVEASFDYVERK